MNRKRLMLFAVLFLIALLIIVFMVAKMQWNQQVRNEDVSDTVPLIDYDQEVKKYGNTIYLLDEIGNRIVAYDSKQKTLNTIKDFGMSSYGKRFFIKNNQLIYCYDNVTYYSHMDGTNEMKLLDGELVYLNDEVCVYFIHSQNDDKILVQSYNSQTFQLTNRIYNSVATSYQIEYIKNNDDSVYFYSLNTNNTVSLLEVDLNLSKVTVIDRIKYKEDATATKYVFSDVMKANNQYFYIIDVYDMTYDKEILKTWYMRQQPDFLEYQVGRKFASYRGDTYYQLTYDANPVWCSLETGSTTEKTWREMLNGDVSHYFYYTDAKLYENEEVIAELNEKYTNYSLNKVIRLNKELYFFISNENGEYVWFRCGLYGDKLQKIVEK